MNWERWTVLHEWLADLIWSAGIRATPPTIHGWRVEGVHRFDWIRAGQIWPSVARRSRRTNGLSAAQTEALVREVADWRYTRQNWALLTSEWFADACRHVDPSTRLGQIFGVANPASLIAGIPSQDERAWVADAKVIAHWVDRYLSSHSEQKRSRARLSATARFVRAACFGRFAVSEEFLPTLSASLVARERLGAEPERIRGPAPVELPSVFVAMDSVLEEVAPDRFVRDGCDVVVERSDGQTSIVARASSEQEAAAFRFTALGMTMIAAAPPGATPQPSRARSERA